MPKFMISVRSVSGGSFTDSLGATRYLAVPDGMDPKPSHQLSRTEWLKQVMQSFPRLAGGKLAGNLLFVIHGYNNAATDANALHVNIANGLAGNLDHCTIISFDWPSADETFAYLPDLDTAAQTAIILVNAGIKPFLLAQEDDCRVAVHVLGHSMGAYLVREAFDHADEGTWTGSDWAVSQLVLVAGDVAASDFVPGNKDTESMLGHCYRLTNYFNKFDEALQISNLKRIGTEPRVGRVGLPIDKPANTVNMDCSAHFATIRRPGDSPEAAVIWSHSWYFSDEVFFRDLAATLQGGLDRTVIPGRGIALDGYSLTLPA